MLTETSPPVRTVQASAFRVPANAPESDGTFAWDATTLVLVRVEAGGREGSGYSHDPSRPGSGLEFRDTGAEEYAL